MQTQSWKNKILEGLKLSTVHPSSNGKVTLTNLNGQDLSGFNLKNTIFSVTSLMDINFTSADLTNIHWGGVDLRGAIGINQSDMMNSENYIWTDGTVMSRGVAVSNGYIFIGDAHSIDAKLTVDASASVTIIEGARLVVQENVTLDMEGGVFFVSESNHGTIKVQGNLNINDDTTLEFNLADDFDRLGYYEMMIIETDGDGTITGSIDKNNIMIASVYEDHSYVLYDGVWDVIQTPDGIKLIFGTIPEPSTYAAIFGALALGFAAYRRRIAPKK